MAEKKKVGRPKGSLSKATLEKMAVNKAFEQRVLSQADKLFHAQLQLGLGSMKVFRADEDQDGKRVHTLVTDADEIKSLLDECDGMPGTVGGKYYFFAEVLPDNRAIESLLNRGIGKPAETKSQEDKMPTYGEIAQAVIDRLLERGWRPDAAQAFVRDKYNQISDQIH